MITILTVPLFEWMLGTDHPDTLRSRNNLAMSYLAAGRPSKAIPLYKRTLADCERVLGADHPNTLRSRNNLAMSLPGCGADRRGDPTA